MLAETIMRSFAAEICFLSRSVRVVIERRGVEAQLSVSWRLDRMRRSTHAGDLPHIPRSPLSGIPGTHGTPIPASASLIQATIRSQTKYQSRPRFHPRARLSTHKLEAYYHHSFVLQHQTSHSETPPGAPPRQPPSKIAPAWHSHSHKESVCTDGGCFLLLRPGSRDC
ncbi:hypothetical protein EJ06DRAFT_276613 [Trichodelitschia bisporula]|uniref:Uncharacterized protein n=1 Tax=Trichodelitschia bisporula TaxID=703511 RepID=A0A6G1I5R5_9PEZI|nr:hypothetical protein EJ06DRAFT_276613 [Trichodelitschia bisporula]